MFLWEVIGKMIGVVMIVMWIFLILVGVEKREVLL